ncbi:hypothetical protein F4810DRAFT_307852 [Camillea tinctor]|nr:hypothetical protein F4810DRAFT_307852 [Camillea tinctor]
MATSNPVGMWIPPRDETDESAHQRSRELTHHIPRAMTVDYTQYKLEVPTKNTASISVFAAPSSAFSLLVEDKPSNDGFRANLFGVHIPTRRSVPFAVVERRQPLDRFGLFRRLPPELRVAIWEMTLEPRIVCIRTQAAYTNHAKSFPSTKLPLIYEISSECQALLHARGTMFRFFDSRHRHLHQEWFDRRSDIFYVPSIRVLYSWTGWERALAGATVLANVLELIEDPYRGSECNEMFERLVRHGSFNGVKTFYLSLITIECGEDLDIYGKNSTAVVDLDDKRLPDLLRPAFENIRNSDCFNQNRVVHKTPARLLKHLHAEWDRDLKTAFEEHWLQGHILGTRQMHPSMFTNKQFGFENGRRYLDRDHRMVADLLQQMPKIRPVIIFEKRWPASDMFLCSRWREFVATVWNQGRRFDGLEVISNRRRMVLSTELKVGRRTHYA